MRTAHLSTLLLLASLSGLSGLAQAQSAAPPNLQKLEEGDKPSVNIPDNPTEHTMTDTKQRGKVVSTEVVSGKSKYTVKNPEPAGSALSGDVQGSANRGAQWKVLQFNGGRKLDTKEDVAPAALPPAPPPPAMPASAK